MLALPALVKGVFYDDDCLQGTWDLVRVELGGAPRSLRGRAKGSVAGPHSGGIKLLDLARELLAIASVGLARQDVRNSRGENETIYLDALDRQLASGRSPAHDIRERWETAWEERIEELIEFAAYQTE